MQKIGPALSPVNYDAWYREGYMPPSEHVLIDRLQRGAKVVASTSGEKDGVWLVIQGNYSSRKIAALSKWFLEQSAILDEEEGEVPSRPTPGEN